MSTLSFFILNYSLLSYAAIFVGVFLEGEGVFLLSSVFANEGDLRWGFLAAAALAGLTASDLFFYALGRYAGGSRIGRWIGRRYLRYHAGLEEKFFERYGRIAFFSKFVYVVNKAVPFIAGWRRMPFPSFLKAQAVSSVLWVGVMLIVGHSLGIIISLIGEKQVFRRLEIFIIALMAAFLIAERFIRRFFSRKLSKVGRNSNGT